MNVVAKRRTKALLDLVNAMLTSSVLLDNLWWMFYYLLVTYLTKYCIITIIKHLVEKGRIRNSILISLKSDGV